MAKQQNDFGAEAQQQTGYSVMYLGVAMQGMRDLEITPIGISIRGPRTQGDEFLATLRGVDADGARWVAFHSAFELAELLRGVESRLRNGSHRWKEDQYAR